MSVIIVLKNYWSINYDTITRNKHKQKMVQVTCVCGVVKTVLLSKVETGKTRSCGCKTNPKKLFQTTHGMRHTKIYEIWLQLKQRCENPKNKNYKDYGGRGIKVDPRWSKFENFFADMGDKPFDGATLDRIDNDGDYTKDNCRWATRKEQRHNQRK